MLFYLMLETFKFWIMKYILKIGDKYISGNAIMMGIPEMNEKIGNAISFTYDEAVSKIQMICFDARMIEI